MERSVHSSGVIADPLTCCSASRIVGFAGGKDDVSDCGFVVLRYVGGTWAGVTR